MPTDGDDELRQLVHALRARIAELEANVVELRLQLAEASSGRFASMRALSRCPACGGRSLLHFRKVYEKGHDNCLSLLALHTPVAPLEAYACRACKLVEWHATNLARVPTDDDNVVALDPDADPPKNGPFR